MNGSSQEYERPAKARGAARRSPAAAVLLTGDGVPLRAIHRPPLRETAGGSRDLGTAAVLAHGFSGRFARPEVQRIAGILCEEFGVVTFSFRGHGTSSGRSTVGDLEVLDIEAAAAWARSLGYRRIVTVGFSMGAAVALRHAALCTGAGATDAVAAVSAPGRWYYKGTAPMRRLHWAVQRPAGRAVARWILHTRIHPEDWAEEPLDPRGAAAATAARGVPLLVVHGDADPYFPLSHGRGIHEAAAAAGGPAPAELWVEHGMGHAENAAGPELVRRVAVWLRRGALATDPAARVPSAPDDAGEARTREGA